jgi:nicotinate-nucleotide adenylyltransferase
VIRAPLFSPGQRIGLFGGSFNPAHQGHRAVALFALKRLRLDFIWWVLSPQNPLKDPRATDDYGKRLAQTRRIASHPRFIVTDLERRLGTRTTADFLARLRTILKRGKFVWIMGADSFANLHRWHDWTDIAEALPLAVLARPGYSIRALNGQAALKLVEYRMPSGAEQRLPGAKAPAWVFIPMPLRRESSTEIRSARARRRTIP